MEGAVKVTTFLYYVLILLCIFV